MDIYIKLKLSKKLKINISSLVFCLAVSTLSPTSSSVAARIEINDACCDFAESSSSFRLPF